MAAKEGIHKIDEKLTNGFLQRDAANRFAEAVFAAGSRDPYPKRKKRRINS